MLVDPSASKIVLSEIAMEGGKSWEMIDQLQVSLILFPILNYG
jgi:hypothetical protein